MHMQPTKSDFAVIALMMQLFPKLRLKRKVLTESERAAARAQVRLLSKFYRKLAMR